MVGRLVGHKEVTQTSRCLFSFITGACPSQPFYALRATPKTAVNFGWSDWLVGQSVGWSVGWSCGSHMNVMLPLQFRHPGPTFLTLLHPAGHPQNGLKFWSIGQSVSRLVARSVRSNTNVTQPLPFRHPSLSFPTLLRPAGHPQNGLKFWSVRRSVGHREVT